MAEPEDIQARARRVRLILLDVDGVLTDGSVHVSSSGGEYKSYFIRDGLALVWARRAGFGVGLLSGRASEATTHRATELGIPIVVQGRSDKHAGYREIVGAHHYADEEVAYMADDLLDLPVLTRVGLSAAPADAIEDVRTRVHWVSRAGGGRGAVRELVELIFRAQGRWDDLVGSYLT